MPLVKEARTAVPTMSFYALGSMLGAATTGGLIGVIGTAISGELARPSRAIIIALAAAALFLADLRSGLFRSPSLRRQTCSTWYRRFGAKRTFLIWGFDLGLGFSTIRVSSLFWVLAIVTAVALPPDIAPAVMLLYGLALPLSVVLLVRAEGGSDSVGRVALALAPKARIASLAVLCVFVTSTLALLVFD